MGKEHQIVGMSKHIADWVQRWREKTEARPLYVLVPRRKVGGKVVYLD